MSESSSPRWQFVKDVAVFQVKLALDALRDFLLSPMSFVCAVIDLWRNEFGQKSKFYQLMKLGRKSDHWLGLFESGNNTQSNSEDKANKHSADDVFFQLEKLIKNQHAKGGITASAKSKIDDYLDKLTVHSNSNVLPDDTDKSESSSNNSA